MILSAENLDIIFRGAANTFQSALSGTPTLVSQIATPIPMSTRQLTQAWLDRIPMMRKWKGNRVINSAFAHSRTITAELFEDTVSLDKFDVKDDNLGIFSKAVEMLGQAVAKHPDQLNWDFLKQASVLLGYDKVPVYATNHPLLGGPAGNTPPGAPATQSNLLVNTALTWSNFNIARTAMRSWKGADGAPMMVGNGSLVLMVPPSLETTARQIVETTWRSDIGGNAAAPQENTLKGAASVLVNPWASAWPNNWWLLDTSSPIKPYADYTLDAPTFTYLTAPTDQNVFMAHEFLYGAEKRAASSETVWWLSLAATSEANYIAA